MFTETLDQKCKRLEEIEKKHKGINYEELWNGLKTELINAKEIHEQCGDNEISRTMGATLLMMKSLENKQLKEKSR